MKSKASRKYRIELPNIYDDSGLDPYEFRLLAHYVRRGVCNESVRTTSNHCCMAMGMVTKSRNSLLEKGFIRLVKTGSQTFDIHVMDKWGENEKTYSNRSPREQSVQDMNGAVQDMNGNCSPHETKKEHSKEEPIKKDIVASDTGEEKKLTPKQKKKKDTPSPSSATPPSPDPQKELHNKLMALYCKWHEGYVGAPAKIDKSEGEGCSQLSKYLLDYHKGDQEKAVVSLDYILRNWDKNPDKFLRSQIRLKQINSRITEFFNAFKNGNHQKNQSKRLTPNGTKPGDFSDVIGPAQMFGADW